jgi:peptidoglycan-N-acetylglucosamine deacetylase
MPNVAKYLIVRALDEMGNLLLRPPLGGMGRVALHGPRTAKRVAITYDDGPNAPSTNDILDALGECEVKATFFCVGENAVRHSGIVKRAFSEGHVIGNHSMFHSRKTGLMIRESAHIDDCTAALTTILGVVPHLYRAPWGWLTPWETSRLHARNLSIIGWDVYTYDWQTPPPDGTAMAAAVERDALPGSIILLHDGRPNVEHAVRPQTVTATIELVRRLRARGFEFVTVPELLGIEAYLPRGEAGARCPSQTS